MKVLIVDDEAPIRDYIAACIKEAGDGCTLTASLSRASQVLEQLRSDPVDVVFTDITMPRMDGLELLQQIKDDWPDIDVVILTCHDDFSYARTAMQRGATDYMLKDEITPRAMQEVLARLDARRQQFAEKEHRLHVSQYFASLRAEGEERPIAAERLAQYGIPTNGSCFAFAFRYSKPVLDTLALKSYPWLRWQLVFSYEPQRIALLACAQPMLEERKLRTHLTALHNEVQGQSDSRIGLSELHHDPAYLAHALREAITGMDDAFYPPVGVPQHLEVEQEQHLQELFILRNNAIAALTARDSAGFADEMESVFAFARKHQVSVSRLKRLLDAIATMQPDGETWADIEALSRDIRDAQSLDALRERFRALARAMERDSVQYSSNIEQAVRYLRAHFNEEVSLQSVAQSVFLNNEYFSRRFKKETGINFSEYLQGLRLEEARRLLRMTEQRVGEVAERVGIGNVSYFSMLYKKQYGVTPNEERKRI